jgi:hypothetical protein
MRSAFVIFLLIFNLSSGFSQSEKTYRQRALEVQHEIWDDTTEAFKVTQIPADMNQESGVILASSFELDDDSKSVLKLTYRAEKLKIRITDHMRVKLNDHNAVSQFSTIEYLKNSNDTKIRLYDIFWNVSDTYIGVKIISPDGTETVIPTDDDVLKKNGKKQDRFYIPGLKEGDILDFYARIEKCSTWVKL